MVEKEKKLNTLLEGIKDLFKGKAEYSHMTGDLSLCGKTADDALKEIIDNKEE